MWFLKSVLAERIPFSGDSGWVRNVLFFSKYANSVKIVIPYNISPVLERLKKCKKRYEIFMKSKASTGTAREGREKQGGPAAGRRLCFHLTHGPLRFMTFSTCRSLDERHERKGGRAA